MERINTIFEKLSLFPQTISNINLILSARRADETFIISKVNILSMSLMAILTNSLMSRKLARIEQGSCRSCPVKRADDVS